MSEEASKGEDVELFVRLLGQNQRRIYQYVLTLVHSPNDAEEIVQEANLVLWREFSKFVPGTNFIAWASRIAFHQVLAWRKRRIRDRHQFSVEFLELIAAETADRQDQLEERTEYLRECLEKLPEPQRTMIRRRYGVGERIEQIADACGKSTDAVYRALSRIRHTLHECVERSVAVQRGS